MSHKDKWNPDLYDSRLGFVSGLGRGVVELLAARKGERILDLGCGTGDLTWEIAETGAIVTGLDQSAAMLQTARAKYPRLRFIQGDAESFRSSETFDAVFSNAALHWMKRAEDVARAVWLALAPGGRFVAEFGGKGNVAAIAESIAGVMEEDFGIVAESRNPWFYPSIGEYAALLERQGFRVAYAIHFDRPTPLTDGENGLDHWLELFASSFFEGLDARQKLEAIRRIKDRAKPLIYEDGVWIADYKRIRIAAFRP